MRAVALHSDLIVATSRLFQTNCVLVRGSFAGGGDGPPEAECFVIDSPVLPDELELLQPLVGQASFPEPSALLATHGDWDHVLARLAFPELSIGCAPSTCERLRREPGAAQRRLREFDDELYLERPRPLALGAVQELPVPGRCELGSSELELLPAEGHTCDGMAVWVPWAEVLVAGDYLSPIEIPSFADGGGSPQAYLNTLDRFAPLLERAAHVVPGHGPPVTGERAGEILAEDRGYLRALLAGGEAPLPRMARSAAQRKLHESNLAALAAGPGRD